MSLSVFKGALAVAAACGILAGVAPSVVGPGNALPASGPASAARRPPADDPALKKLLDQYSKAYADCKSIRRKLAAVGASLPASFAATQRELLAKRQSACQQAAPGKLAQDGEEAKQDAEIGQKLLRLAAKRQRWQDSVSTQADKQLAAGTKALDQVALALRQALAAKRKGFRFQLHGITYQAYVADLKDEQIQLHLNQDSVRHTKFTNLERLRDFYKQRGQSPAMLTNAGMFHANQEPVGLLIANGVVVHPLNTQQPVTDENFYMRPNGVFFVDAHNVGHVDSTGGYQRQWEASARQPEIREATQSGPMLVVGNRINAHFFELSTNAKVRSGVGIVNSAGNTGDKVVFLATDGESTFYDFATTFRDLFACSNALFLDGAISKMYLAGEQTNYTGGFFGPMVAVLSRGAAPKPTTPGPAAPTGAKPATATPAPALAPAAVPKDTAAGRTAPRPADAKAAPLVPAPASGKGQRHPNPTKGHE